jgi:hypothetical protein
MCQRAGFSFNAGEPFLDLSLHRHLILLQASRKPSHLQDSCHSALICIDTGGTTRAASERAALDIRSRLAIGELIGAALTPPTAFGADCLRLGQPTVHHFAKVLACAMVAAGESRSNVARAVNRASISARAKWWGTL